MSKFIDKLKEFNEINSKDIEKLVFEISVERFQNTEKNKSEFIVELFDEFYSDLKEINLANEKNLKTITFALKHALSDENEKAIFNLINETDRIQKEIFNQKKSMQSMISSAHTNLINLADSKNLNDVKIYLNEIFNEPLSHKFLKETSEFVFVSMIENGFDVEDTTAEAIKNLTYLNIVDNEFSKKYILDIARIIVSKAVLVATESKIFANEIISGAVKGLNLGIAKAIDKFKSDIYFLPKELFNDEYIKELDTIFSDIHAILSSIPTSEALKTNLQNVIDTEFGGYFGKFKKLSNELSEQLSIKIEELNLEEKYKKLRKNLELKFNEISQNSKEISAKLLEIAKDTLKNKKDD